MSLSLSHFYEFDRFVVDARRRRLSKDGEAVSLTPKAFDTLLALVSRHGQVVEKDDLMTLVWPDTAVEEGALSRNIYLLRKALGEGPEDRRFIVTVPGRGYSFVAEIIERPADSPAGAAVRSVDVSEAAAFIQPAATGYRSWLVAAAIAGIVLSIGAAVSWNRRATAVAAPPTIGSLAVLPFMPLAANDQDTYLGLGMADILATRLHRLPGIVVRPTAAISRYADRERDALAAGRELRVEAVLDGTIHRQDGRIRVTARLVSVASGEALWAAQFDEDFTDVFAVEDRLADRLGASLATQLTGDDPRRLARRGAENAEAFQAYSRGRYFWRQWNRASLEKAIVAFNEASAADASFAPAYSGLADTYNLLGYLGLAPPHEMYPKSRAAALRALALDDSLSEAHLSLAKTSLFYDWDWPSADREIARALELAPNSADAHGFRGAYLASIGDVAGGIAARQRAIELDPVSPLTVAMLGWSYYYDRQSSEAARWARKALELDRHFVQAYSDLGQALLQERRHDDAIAAFVTARLEGGASEAGVQRLRDAYTAGGIEGFWRYELLRANESAKNGGGPGPWRMARLYAELGDRDRAFTALERAYNNRVSLLTFLSVVPFFDNLRSDPRFADLVHRIGPPEQMRRGASPTIAR